MWVRLCTVCVYAWCLGQGREREMRCGSRSCELEKDEVWPNTVVVPRIAEGERKLSFLSLSFFPASSFHKYISIFSENFTWESSFLSPKATLFHCRRVQSKVIFGSSLSPFSVTLCKPRGENINRRTQRETIFLSSLKSIFLEKWSFSPFSSEKSFFSLLSILSHSISFLPSKFASLK